jgi:hypothetical protein
MKNNTSAYEIQTPGNYPEESVQRLEEGETLKSKLICLFFAEIIIPLGYSDFLSLL